MTACLAPGCPHEVTGWPPACTTHWFALPMHIQAALRRNARADGSPIGSGYTASRLWAVQYLADAQKTEDAKAQRSAEFNRRIMGEREE